MNAKITVFAIICILSFKAISSYMVKEKRFEYILSALKQGDMITYFDLSEHLKVSEDTIRRDIDLLHKSGLLSKVKGGAMARNKNPLSFQDRIGHLAEEKEIIGQKVQPLLSDGMTIFMDGGSTICTVAEHFLESLSVRIITNNLALVPILSRFKNISLFILGGEYNKDTGTNVGVKTCADAEQYIADIYLMGGCAVSKDAGITSTEQNDGAAKKAMLKGSKKVMLLVNSQKIETNEFFKVCDLKDIDILITELPSDDSWLNPLRFQNVTIL
jgi:DeoR/GlpR family transcriptional regulator of sugar metabolism